MFDFFRDRGSTAEDKRGEALSAYLDNALMAAERERLEGQIARDPALRAELERMRVLKLQMRAMPRRRVPRSFALDPALYGRPKAQPVMQLYPVLRGATALTAFLLIFILALGAFRGQSLGGGAPEPAAVSESVPLEQAESFEAADVAAPMEESAAAEEERSAATSAPQMEAAIEAPTELAAQENITGTFAFEASPSPEGTLVPEGEAGVAAIPEGDLALESAAPTAEPTVALFTTEATAVAELETVPEAAGAAVPVEEGDESTEPAESGPYDSLLRPIQIGLAIAFVSLFILWLIARRRVRSL